MGRCLQLLADVHRLSKLAYHNISVLRNEVLLSFGQIVVLFQTVMHSVPARIDTFVLFTYFVIMILLQASCSRAKPTSHYNATPMEYANASTCGWTCLITNSDFSQEMKALITESKLIKLDLNYDEIVDQRCFDRNRTKIFDKPDLWIWLPDHSWGLSHYVSSYTATVFKSSNILIGKSQGHKEVNVSCAFVPDARYAQNSLLLTSNNRLIALLLIQGIANTSQDFHGGSLCYAETKHSAFICFNINKTGDNSDNKFDFRHKIFVVAEITVAFISMIAFALYLPAVLCLFPATEVTDRQGTRVINLEGPSPVGLRSLVANYFHSEKDSTCRAVTKYILRVTLFIIPVLIPIAGPSLKFVGYESIIRYLSIPYCIRGFCLSFLPMKSFRKKRCVICRFVRPEGDRFHRGLLQEMTAHLEGQTLLVAKGWKCFIKYLLEYLNILYRIWPSFEASFLTMFRYFLCIGFVLTIPVVATILIIASLLVFTFAVYVTVPISSILRVRSFLSLHIISKTQSLIHEFIVATLVFPVEGSIVLLATFGIIFTLLNLAAYLALATVGLTVILVAYSEVSLPYVASIVLVCYYLWSCYSSFTNRYRDLAFSLFRQYKSSCDRTSHLQAIDYDIKTPISHNKVEIMRIPKDLFDFACEELSPVGKGVCVMVIKVVLILAFVFLIFSTIMAIPSANSTTKALATFFTGSLPKIIYIFISGNKNTKLNDLALEEKVNLIVKDYVARKSSLDHENDEEEQDLINPDVAEQDTLL